GRAAAGRPALAAGGPRRRRRRARAVGPLRRPGLGAGPADAAQPGRRRGRGARDLPGPVEPRGPVRPAHRLGSHLHRPARPPPADPVARTVGRASAGGRPPMTPHTPPDRLLELLADRALSALSPAEGAELEDLLRTHPGVDPDALERAAAAASLAFASPLVRPLPPDLAERVLADARAALARGADRPTPAPAAPT